jgi:hypothetical protein
MTNEVLHPETVARGAIPGTAWLYRAGIVLAMLTVAFVILFGHGPA